MKILQQAIKVKRHSRVNVSFSRPCTVYLMTEVNYKRYKEGASFRRLGGEFKTSPAEFIAPYDGTWHAVIEKGSHYNPKAVEGSVEVLPPLMKDIPYLSDEDESRQGTAETIDDLRSFEDQSSESQEEASSDDAEEEEDK